ncbi:GTPase domain-containing protein [Agitococcus lubricus]|uniref:50S ribosome-binding GTPase n=1 Tax=Agitococcus lubricus TaxID=1077255 RepID=A0A2T5IRU8_9GAMM|nr:GTPase domain-containing protein [Agitococcus lubricus]PTQ86544.1 50S ribosome-binding GTPase [Agitococcus lubricus]
MFNRSQSNHTSSNNVELEHALKVCNSFAEKGYWVAHDNLKRTGHAIQHVESTIQNTLESIKKSQVHSPDILDSIQQQLNNVMGDLHTLQRDSEAKLEERRKHLKSFNISLFGRTMAGKSTLMEILTNGDGKSIGKGQQRTTRNLRTYTWKGLTVTDVPGIAAFEGHIDETVAFDAATMADLIVFLITDDSPQPAEADCFVELKKLGKPILAVCNVKTAIQNSEDLMDFLSEPDYAFNAKRLNELTEQFIKLVDQHLPGASAPFIAIHAHARYLADKPEHSKHRKELLEASRFAIFEKQLIRHVIDNGRFFRLKTFIDASVVPMYKLSEELLRFKEQNFSSNRVLAKKIMQFVNWNNSFLKRGTEKIDAFCGAMGSTLSAEIVSFAEDNYENKNAGDAWDKVVKSLNFEKKSSDLMSNLHKEAEAFLKEFFREVNAELTLVDSLKSESIVMPKITDTRKIARWLGVVATGAVTLAAMLGPVSWMVVVGVAVVSGFFSWFTDSKDSKAAKARSKLESTLEKHVEKLKKHYRDSLFKWFKHELIEKQIGLVESNLHIISSALSSLANTQVELAEILKDRQAEMNYELVKESLKDIYKNEFVDGLLRVARAPGYMVVLCFQEGFNPPVSYREKLELLLAETVIFIVGDYTDAEVLQHLFKHKLGEQVHNIVIDSELKVARVPLDTLDEETSYLAAIAYQLTKLHVIV